jgi:beta-alanine--pyruvate transaminase
MNLTDAKVLAQPRLDAAWLEPHWMPYTGNRNFKAHPRMIVGAEGCYYTDSNGRKIFDGLSGLWTCGLGHGRAEIVEAARHQLATLHRAISSLLARRSCHAPLDFRRVERIEQLISDLLNARRREANVRDLAIHAGRRRDRRRRIVLRTCCSIHVHLLFSFI